MRWLVPFALFLSSIAHAAPAPYDVAETAVAAFTNAGRSDLAGMCAQCQRLIDHAIDCSSWGTSGALPPFHYERRLSDAARFHSRHMHDGPCFQHESCCELKAVPGGLPVCATPECNTCNVQCAGTEPAVRYPMLGYATWAGENIAAGQTDSLDVTCAWLNSPGHRANILSSANDLGVGLDERVNSCAGPYWTQSMGARPDRPDPGYVSAGGILEGSVGAPFGPSGRGATIVAHVFDKVGARAPQSVRAVVDGHCLSLSKAVGADGRGLYADSFDPAAGCHQVWFLAIGNDGSRNVFPQDGAIAFSFDVASCPEPTSRQVADCDEDPCAEEGLRRGCYPFEPATENVGVCHGGANVCQDGAFGACAGANEPGLELCNGLDDDCDGVTDDGVIDVGGACSTTGLPGRCAAGHTSCAGGRIVCVAEAPVEESCNGIDDDCDGSVDDGIGSIACGVGACRRVAAACVGGREKACVPGTPAANELCGNGLDDDCDGSADEGCACTETQRACYVGPAATKGVGRCAAGVQRCEAGFWGSCEGARLPDIETCNGLDDDCNGATDEGLGRDACGVGACRATAERCVGGAPQACAPLAAKAETCDGRDDDCNGEVDESCACPPGATLPCSTDWAHAGVGACRAGTRTCDASGTMGACVGEVLVATEVCGNAIDDDCDGVKDDGCIVEPPVVVPPQGRDEGCGCSGSGASAIVLLGFAAWFARRRSDRNRPEGWQIEEASARAPLVLRRSAAYVSGVPTLALIVALVASPLLAASAVEAPRMTVLTPRAPSQAAAVRTTIEEALRDSGATVVPSSEYRAKAKALKSPPTEAGRERTATALELDGLLDLEIARVKGQETPYEARAQLLEPDGDVKWEGTVPLASRMPTAEEAKALATLAVQAARPLGTAPTATRSDRTARPEAPAQTTGAVPGAAPTATSTTVPGPITTLPRAKPLPGNLELSFEPHLTWRSADTTPPAPAPAVDFSTGLPYAGATLRAQAFPFTSGRLQHFGLGASYSFSALNIGVKQDTGDTSIDAHEHRAAFDLLAKWPGDLGGGQLIGKLGLAYEGFHFAPLLSLVPTSHLSPHVAVEYARPVLKSVRLEVGTGLRLFNFAGGTLADTFGEKGFSYGWESKFQLAGSLDKLARGLGWTAGYDSLRFTDTFGPAGAKTDHHESYHRIGLGIRYGGRL